MEGDFLSSRSLRSVILSGKKSGAILLKHPTNSHYLPPKPSHLRSIEGGEGREEMCFQERGRGEEERAGKKKKGRGRTKQER